MTQPSSRDSIEIDVRLVTRLVADQFSDWADLAIKPVKNDGHDNRTFHLGDQMSVRVPSAQEYAAHIHTEQRWLPKLATQLPLPIPNPLALGEPAYGLPWHWTVNTWLEGENASAERISNMRQFARDLAYFLNTLQSIDTSGAPPPGPDNFFRGGELHVYDDETRQCINSLRDVVDARGVTEVWESALREQWRSTPVWIHGDVAVGNLLVKRGKLCAVIDFGQLAAGDPACDLTIAWTLFSGENRDRFRREIAVDEATWVRARAWAVWKALLQLRRRRQTNSVEAATYLRVIENVLSD